MFNAMPPEPLPSIDMRHEGNIAVQASTVMPVGAIMPDNSAAQKVLPV